jgi:hypothetical protein
MSVDPRRLFEDPSFSAKLRADLATATDAGVTGLDVAAGATRLSSAVAAEPIATGAATGAATGGASVTGKVLVGALAVGGLVGFWTVRGDEAPAVHRSEAAVHVQPAHEAPAEGPPVIVVEEPDLEEQRLDEDVEELELELEPDEATPSPVSKRRAVPGRRASAAPDHRREAELVARARRALATDPDQAWRLTRQLGKEFPNGLLVEEREALAIRSLAALDRKPEALRRARAFLVDHGEGPHADAIRRAVGL